MKKWILLICIIFSASPVKAQDLTQFDFPLLIGDWFWFSPQQGMDTEGGSYKAINISFASDYTFSVKLLRMDGKVEEAEGEYDLDDTTLVLTDEFGENQRHSYQLNHYQLMLQGAKFTKILSQDLTGQWSSDSIRGDDVGDNILNMSLRLRPDFLFSVRVNDKEGKFVTHQGVYFLEDDHIVLIYKGGQHDSQFELAADTLTLSNNTIGMEAVLKRNEP